MRDPRAKVLQGQPLAKLSCLANASLEVYWSPSRTISAGRRAKATASTVQILTATLGLVLIKVGPRLQLLRMTLVKLWFPEMIEIGNLRFEQMQQHSLFWLGTVEDSSACHASSGPQIRAYNAERR